MFRTKVDALLPSLPRLVLRAVAPALLMTLLAVGLLGQRVEARTQDALLARAECPVDQAATTGLVEMVSAFPESPASPEAAVADAVMTGANRNWNRGVALLLSLGSVLAAMAAASILSEQSARQSAQTAPMG